MKRAAAPSGPDVFQPVGMARAGEKLWVAKVPKFLSDHLTEVQKRAPGAALGKVSEKNAGGAGGASFALELSGDLEDGMPREYDLRFGAPPAAMHVLSHAADGRTTLEGRVERKGALTAPLTPGYRRLLAERSAAAERSRTESQLATIGETERVGLQKDALGHVAQRAAEKVSGTSRAAKREARAKQTVAARMSHAELKLALKECFAQQDFWLRRELEARLGNKDKLGACLEELCVKVNNHRSTHHGDWQLKPELRTGLRATDALE
jgi:hypothetical protein